MAITKIELELACRKVSRTLVHDPGGWLDDITAVISNLKAPHINKSPVAAEKLALLSTFISLVDGLSYQKKRGNNPTGKLPDFFSYPAKFFLRAVKIGLKDVKNRIEGQLINIDHMLTTGRYYDKDIFINAFHRSAIEMTSDNGDSFLSMVIVPGVLFAGEKRLAHIANDEMAEFYSERLLSGSKIFDIHHTSADQPESIERHTDPNL